MRGPAVYKAIAAVTAELARSGIAKNHSNEQEGWAFRGIDDVYNALSPLLAKNKLCILPRILERQAHRRQSGSEAISHVALRVAFDFVAANDGSTHCVEMWGEGVDRSDKATNKALAAAYKYAAFQVFCIPIAGQVDGDAETLVPSSRDKRPSVLEPVQGWNAWTADIVRMLDGCETVEALGRVQTTYRHELYALSSYDAAAYKQIGEAVAVAKRKLRGSTPQVTDQPVQTDRPGPTDRPLRTMQPAKPSQSKRAAARTKETADAAAAAA